MRGPQRLEACDPLGARVMGGCNPPDVVLGIRIGSSERTVMILMLGCLSKETKQKDASAFFEHPGMFLVTNYKRTNHLGGRALLPSTTHIMY